MKRLLKLSKHGIQNRHKALLYVDGKFFEGKNHPDLVNEYLREEKTQTEKLIRDWFKNHPDHEYTPEEIERCISLSQTSMNLPGFIRKDIGEWGRPNFNNTFTDIPMVFAHYMFDGSIYIEEGSLVNMDLQTAAMAFKEHYPTCTIYNDDTEDEKGNYQKIAKRLIKSYVDSHDRETALLYVDGVILEGNSHTDCVREYKKTLKKFHPEQDFDFDNTPQGYAHKIGTDIYLDEFSLVNASIYVVAKAIKEKYSNCEIYNNDSDDGLGNYKKIAKRLIMSIHDVHNRGEAIVYADGKIYVGGTHPGIVSAYIKNYDEENMALGFAHKDKNNIYIEEFSLTNTDMETVAGALKEKYPNCEIFNDDVMFKDEDEQEHYEKIAKRLIKAIDFTEGNGDRVRDLAIMYINGKVYETFGCHGECVYEFLEKQNKLKEILMNGFNEIDEPKDWGEIDSILENIIFNGEFPYELEDTAAVKPHMEEFLSLTPDYIELGFAHQIGDNIYLETEPENLYMRGYKTPPVNKIIKALKDEYPDCEIYDTQENENGEHKKVAKRLIKATHGISNRDLAITYIDGEIILDETHPNAVQNYLNKNNCSKRIVNNWCRENNVSDDKKEQYLTYLNETDILPDIILHSISEFGREEINENVMDMPLAFAHLLLNDDGQEEIYVEEYSLTNVDINTVITALKKQFPNSIIFNDESNDGQYKKLAKRLIKATHGIENREFAITYINGQVLEGDNHPYTIQKYLVDNDKLELAVRDWYTYNDLPCDEKDIESIIETSKMFGGLSQDMIHNLTEWDRRDNGGDIFIDSLPIAFAHYADGNIYIEENSLVKTDLNTVIKALKKQYPSCTIYNDDVEIEEGVYEKLAKKRLVSNVDFIPSTPLYPLDYFEVRKKLVKEREQKNEQSNTKERNERNNKK